MGTLILDLKLDKETLEKMYYEERLSPQKIADRFTVSEQAIKTRMENWGIKLRTQSEAKIIPIKPEDRETVKTMYLAGNSCYKIQSATELSPYIVNKIITEEGIMRTKTIKVARKPYVNPEDFELDRGKLVNLYVDQNLSMIQIADKLTTTYAIINRFFRQLKVQTRSVIPIDVEELSLDQEELVKEMFMKGYTIDKIAIFYEIMVSLVRKTLIKYKLIATKRSNEVEEKLEESRYERMGEKRDLTDRQIQMILGSLLGDGSLAKRFHTYSEGHCEAQKEYAEYKANILGKVATPIKSSNNYSRKETTKYEFNYTNKYKLDAIYEMCYPNNVKTICEEWINQIDAFGLTLWFLDDGFSTYNKGGTISCGFSTCGFTVGDCKLLEKLLLKYGISSNTNLRKDGPVIMLSQESINKFMDLIEPFVNEIPCMQYKIKRRGPVLRKSSWRVVLPSE